MGIEICDPSGEAVNNRPMFINDGGSISSSSSSPRIKASGSIEHAHRDSDLPFWGEPGSSVKSPDGTKERVYGPDGRPSRDRHHTDHGHPKYHPNPHDHDWGYRDGKWQPGNPYPSPDGPLTPAESIVQNDVGQTVAAGVAVGVSVVVVYEVVKWGVAIAAAPISGGASLVGATLVP